jgi:hypothetical protein
LGHQSRLECAGFPPENGHFVLSSMIVSSGGLGNSPLNQVAAI